jgi:hypothetical protein
MARHAEVIPGKRERCFNLSLFLLLGVGKLVQKKIKMCTFFSS